MKKGAIHELLIGVGGIVLAASGRIPRAPRRITVPPGIVDAVAHDFLMVGKDFKNSIEKLKNARQLEFTDLVSH